MSRPVNFEVHADDVERAKAFSAAAFGWAFQDYSAVTGMAWQGYYLDPEGNTFGIHQPDPEAR